MAVAKFTDSKSPLTPDDPPSWRQFATRTSINGLHELATTNCLPGKLIWSFLISASLGFMIAQLWLVFETYLNEVTGTTVAEWSPKGFPSVAICPDNFIDYGTVEKAGINRTVMEYIIGFAPMEHNVMKNADRFNAEQATQLHEQALAVVQESGLSMDDFITAFSYDVTSVIESAEVRVLRQTWPIEGIERVYTWSGTCYNIHPPRNDSWGDALIIMADLRIRISERNEADFYMMQFGNGLRYGLTEFQRDVITRGTSNLVSVKAAQMLRAQLRRQPCDEDATDENDLYKCIQDYGGANQCKHGCKSLLRGSTWPIRELCNNYLLAATGQPSCNDLLSLAGMTKKEYYLACPPGCTQYTYDASIKHFDQGNGTFIVLYVRDPLKSSSMQEFKIMNIQTFLSNIGGTISLWFGASVISLSHIGYYVVHIITYKLMASRRIDASQQTDCTNPVIVN